MKLFVVASIFVSAMAALIWVGVASQIKVVSVAEVSSPELAHAEIEVKDGQVREIKSWAPLHFVVGSRSGLGNMLEVKSPRSVPENFKLGIDVGLRGAFDPEQKVFTASTVTTKCPSRYEASKEGANAASAYAPTAQGSPESAPAR